MKTIDYRDLCAGLLLAAVGLFVALYASSNYGIGQPARMGPGFFPVMLGWILTALGTLTVLLSLRKTVQAIEPPRLALRPLLAILAAIAVFSLLVVRFGLVPAAVAMTFVASFAERPYNLKRTALLGIGLALLSWLIFTVGLNMTLPAFNLNG